MRNSSQSPVVIYIILLFFSWILTGCFGSGGTGVRYYLIDPVAQVGSGFTPDKPLAIEITDVHIPQYLERFQIVTRNGENRLHFSETNQWGENLRKNLMRTLARNLAAHLSTIDIGTPLNRSASLPDYRIHVHIVQFEQDRDGRVKLVARWQLGDGNESDLGMHIASLEDERTITEGDYDNIVSAMQNLYSQLSEKIAETIIAAESK